MDVKETNSVLVPAPTAWPFMLALGLTLILAGLVTHAVVSIVGAVILLGSSVGWWFDVLPVQKEELVPVTPDDHVATSSLTVDHLAAGNRVQLPLETHPYWTGVWGGLAGAVAMAVVAMLFGLISQGSIWYPINLLGAGVIRSLAEAPVAQLRAFSAEGFIAASLMHGLLSILVGVLYAISLPMFPRGATWRSGLVTPLLWSGLVASTLDLINPTLNSRIDWTWFVGSQIAFGLAASNVIARSAKIATMQSVPLVQRAGIDAQSSPEERQGL